MKTFIVNLIQHDGEHEHNYDYIASGESEEVVRNRIEEEQLYDSGENGHDNSMLSYFDGLTAVSKYWLKEIPEEHYKFLKDNRYMQEI